MTFAFYCYFLIWGSFVAALWRQDLTASDFSSPCLGFSNFQILELEVCLVDRSIGLSVYLHKHTHRAPFSLIEGIPLLVTSF